jgi:hypothetical protein
VPWFEGQGPGLVRLVIGGGLRELESGQVRLGPGLVRLVIGGGLRELESGQVRLGPGLVRLVIGGGLRELESGQVRLGPGLVRLVIGGGLRELELYVGHDALCEQALRRLQHLRRLITLDVGRGACVCIHQARSSHVKPSHSTAYLRLIALDVVMLCYVMLCYVMLIPAAHSPRRRP